MSLQLGVHIGQQNMSMDTLRGLWRDLDGVMDWISVWDHFYEAPPANGTVDHFEAMTTLGALAAETQHARLGCLVFYVGYRNPASIAKAAATLDHISGGRFELGLGAGWHEQEAKAYGYDFPGIGARLDRLDEATTIIRGLLTNERTSFNGEHYLVQDASNLPAPVQARLPIWIGGLGEKKTLRIVAAQADGWNAAYVSPERFAHLNGVLDGWCERQDRDPRTLRRSVNLSFHLTLSEADVARERQNIQQAWGPAASRIEQGALFGTPEQAAEKIVAYRDAGAQMINVALRAPWNAEALAAYVEEVLPVCRRA